jgi:hypothetical protein
MATYLSNGKSTTVTGLGTWTFIATATGPYFLRFEFSENPPSSLIVTINVNGSPIFTSTAPTTQQIASQTKVPMNLAINDTVTAVLTSSAPIDNQLNTVKTTFSVGSGA